MTDPDPSRLRVTQPLVTPGIAAVLTDLMGSLDGDATERLLGLATLQKVTAGTVVIDEFEAARELGFVLSGMLGMVKNLPDGRTHLIGFLVPRNSFGRLFNGPSTYRLEALTDATLLMLERDGLETVLRDNPKIEERMFVHLLDELDAAREWVLMIGGTKVVERVASYLLILLRRLRPANGGYPKVLHQPLSRRDLAHYLGTSRESISRALRTLEDNGALRIESPDTFQITDIRRLVDVAGKDLILEDRDARRPAE